MPKQTFSSQHDPLSSQHSSSSLTSSLKGDVHEQRRPSDVISKDRMNGGQHTPRTQTAPMLSKPSLCIHKELHSRACDIPPGSFQGQCADSKQFRYIGWSRLSCSAVGWVHFAVMAYRPVHGIMWGMWTSSTARVYE